MAGGAANIGMGLKAFGLLGKGAKVASTVASAAETAATTGALDTGLLAGGEAAVAGGAAAGSGGILATLTAIAGPAFAIIAAAGIGYGIGTLIEKALADTAFGKTLASWRDTAVDWLNGTSDKGAHKGTSGEMYVGTNPAYKGMTTGEAQKASKAAKGKSAGTAGTTPSASTAAPTVTPVGSVTTESSFAAPKSASTATGGDVSNSEGMASWVSSLGIQPGSGRRTNWGNASPHYYGLALDVPTSGMSGPQVGALQKKAEGMGLKVLNEDKRFGGGPKPDRNGKVHWTGNHLHFQTLDAAKQMDALGAPKRKATSPGEGGPMYDKSMALQGMPGGAVKVSLANDSIFRDQLKVLKMIADQLARAAKTDLNAGLRDRIMHKA
jgi:hypothetical protein